MHGEIRVQCKAFIARDIVMLISTWCAKLEGKQEQESVSYKIWTLGGPIVPVVNSDG
jgi:hypothetical protein